MRPGDRLILMTGWPRRRPAGRARALTSALMGSATTRSPTTSSASRVCRRPSPPKPDQRIHQPADDVACVALRRGACWVCCTVDASPYGTTRSLAGLRTQRSSTCRRVGGDRRGSLEIGRDRTRRPSTRTRAAACTRHGTTTPPHFASDPRVCATRRGSTLRVRGTSRRSANCRRRIYCASKRTRTPRSRGSSESRYVP